MVGYYSLSAALTYLNAASAIIGMFFAVKGNIAYAMIFLIISGVFDMFDGTVARRKERTDDEKCYGIQIDALADVVSFGLFPAVIGYAIGLDKWFHLPMHILIVLAAITRLSYFNVTEISWQNQSNEPQKSYVGLPVTGVAMYLPLVYVLSRLFHFPLAPIYGILMVVTAIAFITRIKVPKIRARGLVITLIISIPTVGLLILMAENIIK